MDNYTPNPFMTQPDHLPPLFYTLFWRRKKKIIYIYIYIHIFSTLLSYYFYLPWSLSSIYNNFTPYIFAFKSLVCLSKNFKMFFIRLLLASAITFCFTSFVFGATVLVDDESMYSLSHSCAYDSLSSFFFSFFYLFFSIFHKIFVSMWM